MFTLTCRRCRSEVSLPARRSEPVVERPEPRPEPRPDGPRLTQADLIDLPAELDRDTWFDARAGLEC